MSGDWLRWTGLGWLLVGAVPAAGEVLTWTHGDQMQGQWLGVEEGWLKWQADELAESVRLWMPRLHRWEARAAGSLVVAEAMTGAGKLRLQDGSVFSADLEAGDPSGWQMTNAFAGKLTVRPAAVSEWLRRDGGGPVRYAGPAGAAGFVPDNRGTLPGQSWETVPGGSLQTRSIDQSISMPMALPEKLRLDVWLRTEAVDKQPQFRLKIRRLGQGVELETWLEELVGLGERKPERLGSLYEPHFAGVLCIDFKAKKALAYDLQGKELMSWKVRGQATKVGGASGGRGGLFGALAGAVAQGLMNQNRGSTQTKEIENGLTLVNLGESLSLERLIVREWDGEPPPPRPKAGAFVEMLDGQVHEGAVVSVQAGVVKVGQQALSLEQVLWIHAGHSEKEKKASDAAPQEPELGCWARFADGSFFRGEMKRADAESVTLTASWSAAEVLLPKEKVISLRWYVPEPGEGPLTMGAEHLDEWVREGGKNVTRGHWQPAAGKVPLWRPDGADQAVAIKESGGVQISRAFPAWGVKERTLSAVAHLQSGEAVPVELKSWSAKQVEIGVPMAVTEARQTLPMTEVRALELAGPPLQPQGFRDPNWVQTRGAADGAVLSADKQNLALQPGAAFAHGSFLQGSQLSFLIGGENAYGALRLRLFCQGADEKSAHVPVIVSCSGGTVYCGVEDAKREGQMVGNTNRIPVPRDKPCQVVLKWSAKQLEMLVNGHVAFKQNLTTKSQSGTGIVLEPLGLWGNQVYPVALAGWQLQAAPGARSRPVVETEVKQWALQVPRRSLEDPPRHFLVGQNGDVLRGTLEGINSRLLTLRSGLETLEVPRDRVAMLILPKEWDQPAAEEPKPSAKQASAAKKRWWLTTTDGAALHWEVTSFGPEWVEGESAALGRCRIPASQVVALSTDSPQGNAPSFADWKWIPAPEPVLPSGPSGESGKMVGQTAPMFELELVSGGKFKLAEAKGKVVVLDFWASWCGPCLKAMPEIMAAMKDLPPDQVQLIGVNQAQSKQEVATFLETRGWELAVVLDTDQKVGKLFGVEGIPHTVVIGPDGKIAWAKVGYTATAAQELREAIQKLLP